MLPTPKNFMSELVDRWFQAAEGEEVQGKYFDTSDRMTLFKDTEEAANSLKKLKIQGNIKEAEALVNVILNTFEKHKPESELLVQWISHYTISYSKNEVEGAYKSLHYLFETIGDIKNSNVFKKEISSSNVDSSLIDETLLNLCYIDSTADGYIQRGRLTEGPILPELRNLFVEKFVQTRSQVKDANALKMTSKETQKQTAQAFRGKLIELQINTASQAIEYVKKYGPLTYLNISNIPFSPEELNELFNHLPNLKELVAQGNMNQKNLQALANAENLKNLIILDLRGNQMSAEGAKILSDSKNLKNLITLGLMRNEIGKEGAKCLANSENFKNLTTLNLEGNRIGDEGLKALATSEKLKNLNLLNLQGNLIGVEGIETLAASNLKNLRSLNLAANLMGIEGIKILIASEMTKNLLSLNLRGNQIGPEGTSFVASCENLTNLHSLYLGTNEIGDEGIKALAVSNLINLRQLDISNNHIGNEGANILATSDVFKNLVEINVSFNLIGADKAKILAHLKKLEI